MLQFINMLKKPFNILITFSDGFFFSDLTVVPPEVNFAQNNPVINMKIFFIPFVDTRRKNPSMHIIVIFVVTEWTDGSKMHKMTFMNGAPILTFWLGGV